MDIKKELKEIIDLIEANTTVAHDDAGENGTRVAVLEDFSPMSEDSGARDDMDHAIKYFGQEEFTYNNWLERLEQLLKSL